MSPEQATGERQLDARSDLYSLGCVVYEMLAGEPPITGVTTQAIIAKLMTERPVRLRTIRDGVPVAVDEAVAQALAKVPADRFATAEEFAVALSASAPSRRRWSGRQVTWAMGGILGVAALIVVGRLVIHRTPPGPSAVPKLRQFTFTGDANDAAISPDGKTIAYVADTMASLVVEDVSGGGRATLVRTKRWMRLPKWSRDGSQLLYSEGDPDQFNFSNLIAVPRLGGARQDHSPGEGIRLSGPGAYEFGAGDTTLIVGIYTDSSPNNWLYSGSRPETIRRVSADSASAVGRLFRMTGEPWREGELGQFRLSPDGQWLAFVDDDSKRLAIGLVRPTGGTINTLVDSLPSRSGLNTGLAWAPDGAGLYYTLSDGATGAVMRQAVDPKRGVARGKPVAVLENLSAPWGLSLAADGGRLAMGSGFDRQHLVLVRLGVPGGSPPSLTRFSCGTGACFPGGVSPDKQMFTYVKFATSGDPLGDLYLREISGAAERRLAAGVSYQSTRFSADSREVAYLSPVADSQALVVMDVASGRSREVWRGKEAWDVVRLGEGSHGWGVLVRSGLILVGDSIRRVSPPDSNHYWTMAVMSPDGRWAAVRQAGPDGRGIAFRVELATGRETPLLGRGWLPLSWSRDGRILMVLGDTITQAEVAVEAMPAAGGALRRLAVFPPAGRFALCDSRSVGISDDGEVALCGEVDLNSDVYIVDNFGAGPR
jgi:Tol biopolymer transport system component